MWEHQGFGWECSCCCGADVKTRGTCTGVASHHVTDSSQSELWFLLLQVQKPPFFCSNRRLRFSRPAIGGGCRQTCKRSRAARVLVGVDLHSSVGLLSCGYNIILLAQAVLCCLLPQTADTQRCLHPLRGLMRQAAPELIP